MQLHIVVRIGIYDQGIFGIFSTLYKAHKAMVNAKAKEPDDYHEFHVRTYTLNKEGYSEE